MIMLRIIPNLLRSYYNLSGSWHQRLSRKVSSFDLTFHNQHKRNSNGGHQSSDRSSVRLSSSTFLTALFLGAAIYHWRHSNVSYCTLGPQPMIIVDWSPPDRPKKKTSMLTADDKGDSKSVHKSGLSGVELEDIPKSTTTPKPSSSRPSQSVSQSAQSPGETKPSSSGPTSSSSQKTTISSPKDKSSVTHQASESKMEIVKDPEIIDETAIGIPKEVPYVIVGSGTAAMAAARAIRGSDTSAHVLLIGDEPHSPYMRPPLSKELWRRSRDRQNTMLSGSGNMKRHSWMFFESDSFFIPVEKLMAAKFGGIALWKNKRVVRLNVEERYVELDSGERVRFHKCLLATGGRPRQLPVLTAASQADSRIAERVLYFRNIKDFERLREVANAGGKIVIIGGGFLGSELAVSLAELASKQEPRKLEVVQVFRDADGNMAHVLPSYLADHTMKFMAKKGVKIIKSDEVSSASWDGVQSKLVLNFQKGEPVSADYVIVSVGLEANTQLADESGLEVDPVRGGFLVNAELEARGGVFAAGDASSYYDLLLGRRRVEHINHAEESGRIAGRNMAGEHLPYHHQSSFWSSLGREISWDAIGLIDANLETQGFFAQVGKDGTIDYSQPGVVFYLKGSKLVGILLWNLPDDIYTDEKRYAPSRLNLVRKVLDDRRSYSYDELAQLARDFDVYETISEDYEDLKEYMLKKAMEKEAEEQKEEGKEVDKA